MMSNKAEKEKKQKKDKTENENNWYFDTLNKIRGDHSSHLNKSAQYIGYSILIALVYYGKNFVLCNQGFAVSTAISAVLSLVLSHILSLYMVARPEQILEDYRAVRKEGRDEQDNKWIKRLYDKFEAKTVKIFFLFQLTLAVSVILFLISSVFYFFGDGPDCACAKAKSVAVSKTVVAPKAPAENCTPS